LIGDSTSATYLVTGGAGFVGSHLVDALLAQGSRVLVVDDLSTGNLRNLAGAMANPSFRFRQASTADAGEMAELVREADVVFHLAAAVGVQLAVEHPARVIETNVVGTQVVLQAASRAHCRVLIASTSEVYGKGSKIPFSEEDDVVIGATSKSRWSYAVSKMVDELLGLAYQREFGLDVVPFRLFNTVGPRQTGRYGMVVPRFVRQALAGEPITVYGDGTQSRCFCDVQDVVRALIGLAHHPEAPGRVFNIGGSEEVSISQLAERVKAIVGSDSPIIVRPYDEVYAPGFEDMQRRVPATDRIRDLLGWRPSCTLDEIVRRVADWLRSCPDAW
jgi:UDP-glucose 4-epimerase